MVMAEALFAISRDAVLLLFIPREVNLAVFSLFRSSSSHRPCSPAFCKMKKKTELQSLLKLFSNTAVLCDVPVHRAIKNKRQCFKIKY